MKYNVQGLNLAWQTLGLKWDSNFLVGFVEVFFVIRGSYKKPLNVQNFCKRNK